MNALKTEAPRKSHYFRGVQRCDATQPALRNVTHVASAVKVPSRLNQALEAVSLGFHVFRLHGVINGKCTCNTDCGKAAGKHPISTGWQQQITNNPDRVRKDWTCSSNANVGVACGSEFGTYVVDVDLYKPGAKEALDALNLPPTLTRRTGSGGLHFYFRGNLSHDTERHPATGVDFQGNSQYVVYAGCNQNGEYVLECGNPIAELPSNVIERVKKVRRVYEPSEVPAEGSKVLRAAAKLGLLGARLDEATPKYAATCPLADRHTAQGTASKTVIFDTSATGAFHCGSSNHGGFGEFGTREFIQYVRETDSELYEDIFESFEPVEVPETVDLATGESNVSEIVSGIFDNSEPRIVIANLSCGIGKTHQIVKNLCNRNHDRRVSVVVPTHKLADETLENLEKLGNTAFRPIGIEKFSKDHPEKACRRLPLVQNVRKIGGSARSTVCLQCPHRTDYDGSGEPCEANRAGNRADSKISLLQHAVSAGVLRSAKAGERVIFDEMPPLTQRIELTEVSIKALAEPSLSKALGETTAASLARLSKRLLAALPHLTHGMTLRAVLSATMRQESLAFVEPDAEVDANLTMLRNLAELTDPDDDTTCDVGVNVRQIRSKATSAVKARKSDVPAAELARWALALPLLRALAYAAYRPEMPLVDKTEGTHLETLNGWLIEAQRAVRRGIVVAVLSATVPECLRALLGDVPVENTSVHVRDAPIVTRTAVPFASGSRRHMLNEAQTAISKNSVGILNSTIVPLLSKGDLLLITYQAAEKAILSEPELNPVIREALDSNRLKLAHYYATTGIDAWKNVRSLVTLGDPWENIGSNAFTAQVLGVDPGAYTNERAMFELIQCWGRGRSVRRTEPLDIFHVGSINPKRFLHVAPQWVGSAEQINRRGRNPKERECAGSGWTLAAHQAHWTFESAIPHCALWWTLVAAWVEYFVRVAENSDCAAKKGSSPYPHEDSASDSPSLVGNGGEPQKALPSKDPRFAEYVNLQMPDAFKSVRSWGTAAKRYALYFLTVPAARRTSQRELAKLYGIDKREIGFVNDLYDEMNELRRNLSGSATQSTPDVEVIASQAISKVVTLTFPVMARTPQRAELTLPSIAELLERERLIAAGDNAALERF